MTVIGQCHGQIRGLRSECKDCNTVNTMPTLHDIYSMLSLKTKIVNFKDLKEQFLLASRQKAQKL